MSRVRDTRQTVLLAVGTSKAAAIALGLSEMLDAIKPRFSASLTLMESELLSTSVIVDGRGFTNAGR
jgi:N-acetylglucosamine-6-phosphate deacetylase